jgi:hypothetical protein
MEIQTTAAAAIEVTREADTETTTAIITETIITKMAIPDNIIPIATVIAAAIEVTIIIIEATTVTEAITGTTEGTIKITVTKLESTSNTPKCSPKLVFRHSPTVPPKTGQNKRI